MYTLTPKWRPSSDGSRSGDLTRQAYEPQQELSYRKQIARQLRTQYVEGIYRPKYYTMTLKSRFRVTQDHGTIGQIIHDLLLVELSDV